MYHVRSLLLVDTELDRSAAAVRAAHACALLAAGNLPPCVAHAGVTFLFGARDVVERPLVGARGFVGRARVELLRSGGIVRDLSLLRRRELRRAARGGRVVV